MAKFFYSKSNDTQQALQSDYGIILNSSSVKFYKNKDLKATLSGVNVTSMPTAQNICSKLPNGVKGRFTQYFNNIDSDPTPAGTNLSNNAFAYIKVNTNLSDGISWPN